MQRRGCNPMKPTGNTPQRQLRLSDADWQALATIAAREGLLYGGVPSRNEAVRWLIQRDSPQRDQIKPHTGQS